MITDPLAEFQTPKIINNTFKISLESLKMNMITPAPRIRPTHKTIPVYQTTHLMGAIELLQSLQTLPTTKNTSEVLHILCRII